MRILGIAGWSGAGKTTVITRLIPLLRARDLRIATIKHAHHDFDVDIPGKDSYEHRAAGAGEVIVVSTGRMAQVRELRGGPEPTLAELVRRLQPCDMVLVEGFKRAPYPKIEVFRRDRGRAPLHPDDPSIVAIASDVDFPAARLPRVEIDDTPAIRDLVLAYAEPVEVVLRELEHDGAVA